MGAFPDEDPQIPPEILDAIRTLVTSESDTLSQTGAPPQPDKIRDRVTMLIEAARDAAKRRAKDQAKVSEEKLDEILVEGKFYDAFAEFLTDLPLFPYGVMKGPEVRIVPTVSWEGGRATSPEQASPVLEALLAVRRLLDARRREHRGCERHRAHPGHARRHQRSARSPGL